MKFAVIASAIAFANQASAYGIVGAASLKCRKGTNIDSDIVKIYLLGDEIEIVCQLRGQPIFKNSVWALTQDGCYTSDYYLDTGYPDTIFKQECPSGSGAPSGTATASGSSKPGSTAPKTGSGTAKPASTKPTSAKNTKTAKPTSELGSVDEESSVESSEPPKMTKIAPASSEDSSSAAPTAKPSATKPNGASALTAASGNIVAAGVVLAGMLGSLF
ncbi:hypothetical protein GGI12_002381 [Dipsacomyces acuminosporus]|nr:hypothetical protein GGI12_002381 [Dipsacomyces acuminosporus]